VNTRALVSAALTAMLLCSAAPALADTEAITLDYRVAPGCAGRKDFVSRVHTFTSKAEIVDDDGAPHRKFAVRVQRSSGGANGDLTIDDRGTKTTRHVAGSTCDEVLSALALATAIAVDPDALGGPPSEPSEPPKSRDEPAPKPAPPPARPPVAPPPQAKPARAQPPSPPPLTLALIGRVGSAVGPFPKLEAGAELGFVHFEPLEFYVGGVYGPPQANRELRMSDWVGWLAASYRVLNLEPLSVAVRAGLEAGEVRATGLNNAPETTREPWLAADVGVSAELAGPGPLFLQANLGARAPFLGRHYKARTTKGVFQPVYQVPLLGYLVGISVGVHF